MANSNTVPAAMDEGFLLLFFKKEVLFLLSIAFAYLGSYIFLEEEMKTFC